MQLKIQNPCSEDWNKMEPKEQSKYCQSCQKCVVDFTTLSDAQIIDYLQQQKGNVCGRFTASQLNRPLIAPPVRYTNSFTRLFSLGLGAILFVSSPIKELLFAKPATTQSEKKPKADKKKAEIPPTNLMPDSVLIRGTVSEYGSNELIIGATIQIEGTNIHTTTDFDGNFEIYIKQNMWQTKSNLIVSSIEISPYYIPIESIDKTKPLNIQLKIIPTRTMGVVFIEKPSPKKKIIGWFKRLFN